MRNYWLKIAAGALGIFAVGMLVVAAVRSVRDRLNEHLKSTAPISLPLAGLIPFTLDHEKLGAVDRVELLRSEPERIAGVRVIVKLADSASASRFRRCRLVLDDPEHIDVKNGFRCQSPADSAAGLELFGSVVIKGRGDSVALLVPVAAAQRIRATTFRADHWSEQPDAAAGLAQREALGAIADSLDSLAESLVHLTPARASQRRADSLRTIALRLVAANLRTLGKAPADSASVPSKDSIQAMVERALDSARRARSSSRVP